MTTQARPLKWIDIDLDAIRSNLDWVQRRLNPGTRLMAVVKSDAYGHGGTQVARLAMSHGASCLGVATLPEALELRKAGVRAPIILLAPPLVEETPAAARAGLEVTADSEALLAALDRAARGAVSVHLDLDFGLRRWGIHPERLPAFLKLFKRLRRLRLAGVSTHIDYIPGKNAVEAEAKLKSFHRIASKVKAEHAKASCHAANSSIFMDFPHWQMDMARIGNLMYGINPASAPAPLKNPWNFYARIISLTQVAKGRPIGYASEYIAPHHMIVATLPVGYSDGLTMEPAERLIGYGKGYQYWGWLRGRKVEFVGRCGIAHVLVDVSQVPRPRLGETVLLPIRRTAANPRIPRIYHEPVPGTA